MEVSVRDLKGRLSEYLRRVAAGEELIVTSHGKEVARLLPPRKRTGSASTEAKLIARFRNLPWVRPGSGAKPELPTPVVRVKKGERTLSEIVSDQRG